MEIDLNDDKIKDYMDKKLQAIKSERINLESVLKERKKFLMEISSEQEDMDENSVKVVSTTKYVFKNQFVVLYEIQNNGTQPMEKVNIILDWNSLEELNYKQQIFEYIKAEYQESPISSFLTNHNAETCQQITESLKLSNKITKFGCLVVALDLPLFIVKGYFSGMDGVILYQQADTEKMLKVDAIEMCVNDINNVQSMHGIPVTSTNHKDILPTLTDSITKELNLILPENWTSSLDSTFEIHCLFKRLHLNSKCRKFYLVNKQLNDALIVVHAPSPKTGNHFLVQFYVKFYEDLIYLIHYLHQSIPGVLILPETYYKRYLCRTPFEYNLVKTELMENIEKELDFTKKFLKMRQLKGTKMSSEDKLTFRTQLAKLEEQSDFEYLKLSNEVS